MGRILLVDDDPGIAAFLELLLEMEGHAMELATTAAAVRERLACPGSPDLVLLDITLPDADGLEVCRWIKSATALPVLVLSALPGEGIACRAAAAGADGFLPKPFDNAELVHWIRDRLVGSPPTTPRRSP